MRVRINLYCKFVLTQTHPNKHFVVVPFPYFFRTAKMEGFHGAQGGAPTCDGNLRTLADEAAQGFAEQLVRPNRTKRFTKALRDTER